MTQESFRFETAEQPNTNRAEELSRWQLPILNALNMEVGNYRVEPSLLRIVPKADAHIFVFGSTFESIYRDEYENERENTYRWDSKPAQNTEYEGFVVCAANLKGADSIPILHLMGHVTDHVTGFAFRLDEIERVYRYPSNAAEVKAMYQNAEIDGNTRMHNRVRGWAHHFTQEELVPWIKDNWPEPTLIYDSSAKESQS